MIRSSGKTDVFESLKSALSSSAALTCTSYINPIVSMVHVENSPSGSPALEATRAIPCNSNSDCSSQLLSLAARSIAARYSMHGYRNVTGLLRTLTSRCSVSSERNWSRGVDVNWLLLQQASGVQWSKSSRHDTKCSGLDFSANESPIEVHGNWANVKTTDEIDRRPRPNRSGPNRPSYAVVSCFGLAAHACQRILLPVCGYSYRSSHRRHYKDLGMDRDKQRAL
jgi:hypothetical protein